MESKKALQKVSLHEFDIQINTMCPYTIEDVFS